MPDCDVTRKIWQHCFLASPAGFNETLLTVVKSQLNIQLYDGPIYKSCMQCSIFTVWKVDTVLDIFKYPCCSLVRIIFSALPGYVSTDNKHCTADLLDWISLIKLICYYLIKTKQLSLSCKTGGQLHSDTSPVSQYPLFKDIIFTMLTQLPSKLIRQSEQNFTISSTDASNLPLLKNKT